MKLSFIVEELVSPIVTPFILIFKLRFRAFEIIDFLRNYTIDVQGVGDVCSFAQMDVKRTMSSSGDHIAPTHAHGKNLSFFKSPNKNDIIFVFRPRTTSENRAFTYKFINPSS